LAVIDTGRHPLAECVAYIPNGSAFAIRILKRDSAVLKKGREFPRPF